MDGHDPGYVQSDGRLLRDARRDLRKAIDALRTYEEAGVPRGAKLGPILSSRRDEVTQAVMTIDELLRRVEERGEV